MIDGTIATIRPNRGDGYGFGTITPTGGGRGLVFYSADAEGAGPALARRLRNLFRGGAASPPPFDLLTVGQRVTFVVGADGTQAGRPYAKQVRPARPVSAVQ
jgi:cold shock CspA family protein